MSFVARDLRLERATQERATQEPPRIGNPYHADVAMRQLLNRLLISSTAKESIKEDVRRFGSRCANDILDLHWLAGRVEPKLRHFDAQGNRIDQIITNEGWQGMKVVAAEEGLVALGYTARQEYGQYARLHWASKMFLFGPSSGLFNCPLAMTDGATRLIECCDDEWIKERALPHLLSRDPESFWTSGQWMTERLGGSDVARGTETVAVPIEDEDTGDGMTHRLYGVKWFTSATDSAMALALARETVAGSATELIPGNKGLAIFYVELRDEGGNLNDIEVMRLKDKMGTRQLPTAELTLKGTRARKLSPTGRGIQTIATMVNVTRVYNAIAAVGHQRRILLLARDFANRRMAFGKPLARQPAHARTLARMEVESRACMQFAFDCSRLLGLSECAGEGQAEAERLLRLLTPICKLYTGKMTVAITSEGLESFGGHGYVEDSGIPETHRDAHVLSIWEGTTNVLALDVLRVLFAKPPKAPKAATATAAAVASSSSNVAMGVLAAAVAQHLAAAESDGQSARATTLLAHAISSVRASCRRAVEFVEALEVTVLGSKDGMAIAETQARELGFSLARVYCAALLCTQAAFTQEREDAIVLTRYIKEGAGLITVSIADLSNTTPTDDGGIHWDYQIGCSPKPLVEDRQYGPTFSKL